MSNPESIRTDPPDSHHQHDATQHAHAAPAAAETMRPHPRSEGRGHRGGPRGHHRGHRGGHGPWGGRGPWGPPRGRRRERGDVRAAVLLLLAEQPRHGYELLTELADRSDGQWQPSPGSIYPVLKRLRPRRPRDRDAHRRQARCSPSPTRASPWSRPRARPGASRGPSPRTRDEAGASSSGPRAGSWAPRSEQVSELADPAQIEAATAVLVEARKRIYGLLAQ